MSISSVKGPVSPRKFTFSRSKVRVTAAGSADAAGITRAIRAAAVNAFFSPGPMRTSRGNIVAPGTSEPMLTVTVRVSRSKVDSGRMSATAIATGRWFVITYVMAIGAPGRISSTISASMRTALSVPTTRRGSDMLTGAEEDEQAADDNNATTMMMVRFTRVSCRARTAAAPTIMRLTGTQAPRSCTRPRGARRRRSSPAVAAECD
jgi:hypothetical protein